MATLIEDGPRPVFAATRSNGTEPAFEFLDSLDQGERLRMVRVIQKLALGHRLSREDFRKLLGEIFELKDYQTRILCFSTPSGWFLTHGFIKKASDPTPRREIERAEGIRHEALLQASPVGKRARKRKG